jgi:hypothetical protein
MGTFVPLYPNVHVEALIYLILLCILTPILLY